MVRIPRLFLATGGPGRSPQNGFYSVKEVKALRSGKELAVLGKSGQKCRNSRPACGYPLLTLSARCTHRSLWPGPLGPDTARQPLLSYVRSFCYLARVRLSLKYRSFWFVGRCCQGDLAGFWEVQGKLAKVIVPRAVIPMLAGPRAVIPEGSRPLVYVLSARSLVYSRAFQPCLSFTEQSVPDPPGKPGGST